MRKTINYVAGSRAGDMIKGHVEDMPEMEMLVVESGSLDDRIEHLIREIEDGIQDPFIQKLCARILSEYNVPARDWEGESRAIFEWVRENIRYTRDPEGFELFRKPRRTVQLGIADCDDMSILIGSLLSTIGHVILLRIIGVSSNRPEHIYVVDLLPPDDPEKAIALDATRSEPMGWEVSEEQRLFWEDYEPNFSDVDA
jgi:hypothetical protein